MFLEVLDQENSSTLLRVPGEGEHYGRNYLDHKQRS